MDSFLIKFFPDVYRKEKADKSTNQYCKFDSATLTLFTSSLYLAALVASFFASAVTRKFGRKWSMFGGGITFLAGAAINGAAENVAMLIIGRILLGIGVGFANQVKFLSLFFFFFPFLWIYLWSFVDLVFYFGEIDGININNDNNMFVRWWVGSEIYLLVRRPFTFVTGKMFDICTLFNVDLRSSLVTSKITPKKN